MRRRGLRLGLLLTAIAAGPAVLSLAPDEVLFDRPDRKIRHYTERIGEALATRHDAALLATFDEPVPFDWVSGRPLLAPGTEAAPGRFGRARSLDGRETAHIHTRLAWPDLGSRFTLSLWIRLEDTGADQDILFTFSHARLAGLRLRDGRLEFHVPAAGREQVVAAPFRDYGRLVHIAAVADLDRGEAALYQDGARLAAGPISVVDPPPHNLALGHLRWYIGRNPLRAEVDELLVLRRALPPEEVADLHGARRPVLAHLVPDLDRKLRFARWSRDRIRAGLRITDLFHLGRHPGRADPDHLPEIRLHLSRRDRRHINRTHHQSLVSGRRTRDGARPRDIHAVLGDTATSARLSLGGSDLAYPSSGRVPFVLEAGREAPGLPGRFLRLTPIEDAGFLLPLLEARAARTAGLPHVGLTLVRLTVHGERAGIYLAEDARHLGVFPGHESGFFHGAVVPFYWRDVFHGLDDLPPPGIRRPPGADAAMPGDQLAAIYDDLAARYRAVLVNDAASPLPGREIAWRLKQDRDRLAGPARPPPEPTSPLDGAEGILNEFAVLGVNPSPFYLVRDLDLAAFRPPGVSVAWSSSRPDLLDPDGRVRRPAGDRPAEVMLTAALSGGGDTRTRDLRFRVMPETVRVPAIMLHAAEPLAKTRRVDVVAEWRDGTGPPRRLVGTQATRGGIKYRGNASFWFPKKPFSVRLDEPHHLFDDSPTRHLYLMNAYVDGSFLRNRLSYDLFRAFSAEGAPRLAARILWAEVFVNGRYHGLYEMSSRIHRELWDDGDDDEDNLLLKFMSHGPFRDFEARRFVTVLPRRSAPDHHLEPYQDMLRAVFGLGPDPVARAAPAWLDLDNLVDFVLLLNATENRDGHTANFYVARRPAHDPRFFIIPWDYDKTWDGPAGRWHTNDLVEQVLDQVPGLRDRMAARWRDLRTGVLDEDRLMGEVDAHAERLAPHIGWEYARWGTDQGKPFETWVAELRTRIRERLIEVDRFMAADPPGRPPAAGAGAAATAGP